MPVLGEKGDKGDKGDKGNTGLTGDGIAVCIHIYLPNKPLVFSGVSFG